MLCACAIARNAKWLAGQVPAPDNRHVIYIDTIGMPSIHRYFTYKVLQLLHCVVQSGYVSNFVLRSHLERLSTNFKKHAPTPLCALPSHTTALQSWVCSHCFWQVRTSTAPFTFSRSLAPCPGQQLYPAASCHSVATYVVNVVPESHFRKSMSAFR